MSESEKQVLAAGAAMSMLDLPTMRLVVIKLAAALTGSMESERLVKGATPLSTEQIERAMSMFILCAIRDVAGLTVKAVSTADTEWEPTPEQRKLADGEAAALLARLNTNTKPH